MDDDGLQQRLTASRARVEDGRRRLRDVLRRSHERSAAASVASDRATTRLLRARGEDLDPPVPAHPPDWLGDAR